MRKKRKLEEIIKSNFARYFVVPFIFLLLIVAIVNFTLMEEKPKVGAATGVFDIGGGVDNITVQIKTLKDSYTVGEEVNLTDPP